MPERFAREPSTLERLTKGLSTQEQFTQQPTALEQAFGGKADSAALAHQAASGELPIPARVLLGPLTAPQPDLLPGPVTQPTAQPGGSVGSGSRPFPCERTAG